MPVPVTDIGLYVHVPFCSVKCFYCDFAAFSGQARLADRYLAALEMEAALMPARVPTTLYVGGGTPSELSAFQIEALFSGLARAYPASKFVEGTFEGNPESLDDSKLDALKGAPISRVSIGLQTADDGLLAAIGRHHTRADFERVFAATRARGLAVSVDLMYGLPDQTLESCVATMDYVLSLSPEHVSLYGLQVEDRTLFSKRGVEPDEALGRAMFEACLERLARAGMRHYEISNFALPGHESRHNRVYWHDGEYVGLGCGAASHLDGVRSTNVERIPAYCDAVEAGKRPIAERESLAGRAKLGERAFLGLRLIDGFVPGAESEAEFSEQWTRLERKGLVERAGAARRLTREGVFLANDAFMEFVSPL